jgi:hypothetical protein
MHQQRKWGKNIMMNKTLEGLILVKFLSFFLCFFFLLFFFFLIKGTNKQKNSINIFSVKIVVTLYIINVQKLRQQNCLAPAVLHMHVGMMSQSRQINDVTMNLSSRK